MFINLVASRLRPKSDADVYLLQLWLLPRYTLGITVSYIWLGALQMRIHYHCLYFQLSTTYSNAAEVSLWAAPRCSRPEAATNNGGRDGISN